MIIWIDGPWKSIVFYMSMGEPQSRKILKLKGNPFTVLAVSWRMCDLQPWQLNLTGGLSDLFFYIYFIVFNWSIHFPPLPLPSSPLPFHTPPLSEKYDTAEDLCEAAGRCLVVLSAGCHLQVFRLWYVFLEFSCAHFCDPIPYWEPLKWGWPESLSVLR